MSPVTHEWVMSHIKNHVTHDWVMSHMNESCDRWLSHMTHNSVLPHIIESCHKQTSHVTHKRVASHAIMLKVPITIITSQSLQKVNAILLQCVAGHIWLCLSRCSKWTTCSQSQIHTLCIHTYTPNKYTVYTYTCTCTDICTNTQCTHAQVYTYTHINDCTSTTLIPWAHV